MAVLVLLILTLIYTRGINGSKLFNTILTTLKLLTLLLIIVVAFAKFNVENLSPLVLASHGGWKGTFYASVLVFNGYAGYDFVTTLSREAQ